MKQVRIVTDSIADIPAELAAELSITIIPCQVTIGQKAYREGVDLSPQQFYDKLKSSSKMPRTSQPTMGDFVNAYHRLLADEECEGIISIHVADGFSGTVNAARIAAQEAADQARVEVIDSGTVSMGIGWVVVEVARMAQAGATLAEISQAVHALLPRSRTAAMIDTLENLYRGGRISQIEAKLGTALRIKPLISLHGGEVSVWGRARTRSKALKRLAEEAQSWGPLAEMAVLHADAEELARSLAGMLHGLVAPERVILEPVGPALTAHLGLGVVGVCALIASDS